MFNVHMHGDGVNGSDCEAGLGLDDVQREESLECVSPHAGRRGDHLAQPLLNHVARLEASEQRSSGLLWHPTGVGRLLEQRRVDGFKFRL